MTIFTAFLKKSLAETEDSFFSFLQAHGILVTVRLDNGTVPLLWENVTSPWAVMSTGVAAGVTDRKSNLYHVSQTGLKLLAPNTQNVLPMVKRETDSSEKDSFFQPYQGKKAKYADKIF